MKILTGNEAFAAMAAGQKIECRHAESNLDFDDIRDFPATVFIDTAYEFRIAVIYMTIGKMSLPEAIKEAPAKGTQCFVPSVLTEKLSKSFKWKNSDADLAFMQRGLVHLYEQNAVRHAAALIAVGGGAVPAGNDTEAAGLAKADDSLPWEDPAEAEKPQAVPAGQENTAPAEAEQQIEDIKQKAVLDDLLERAATAKTPAEATALTGYTKSWTEEQRKPLVEAIHKRLNELNPPEAAEIKQPPSLLVQIQNAADLTELDCLEIETAGRHPDIQPKLMAAVKRRRAELESQAGEEAS
ncbi:hypothetical protein BEN74_04150 [Acinetobacter sp. WCHAc010034]|uniref:hypothetical protein n=1 Tax=Acinetobacter sp. WCHAc010034 TaxID=1879049 RepID=UPI000E65054A|nr:hypothetical protein [Acinetobacter sp. WCHAc010034]AYA02139.1 hypothetical protein BEN74_04150 [Acinetobacter sp. WCHAc010034]